MDLRRQPIFLAIYSAIEGIPLRQDVAITVRSLSRGRYGVGSVRKTLVPGRWELKVLIPADNSREFPLRRCGVFRWSVSIRSQMPSPHPYWRKTGGELMELIDRTPPHNLEAEQAVLGALLLVPDSFAVVSKY